MRELRKISVVSIIDKGVRFYLTALKSFTYQTYQNTEWLIVDNTGKNLLEKKLEKYIQKDQRIVLISNEKVLSRIDVLKLVFEQTKGEFIAFLNPIDFWVKDKLARQVGFMTRYNAPLSHTSYAFADDKCNLLPIGCYHVQKELDTLNYDMKNPVVSSTLMIDKNKTVINYARFEFNEKEDLMTVFLKSGIVSSGMSDVMTLCRPVFEKELQTKIEGLIKKVLRDNPKDKMVTSRVLEHHAFEALNIGGLRLDPTICIGFDVVESLTRLRNFKV